jgi:hypothetical protein
MKSILLSLTIALVIAFPAFAQNDDNDGGGGPDSPDCKQCWTLQDPTCEGAGCFSMADAAVLNFTAPCTDNYKYACKTWGCDVGAICNVCATCTRLVEVNGDVETEIAVSWAVADVSGSCEQTCAPATQLVTLTQYHNYRLYVRKARCDVANCTLCTCKSEGRVWHPQAACLSW